MIHNLSKFRKVSKTLLIGIIFLVFLSIDTDVNAQVEVVKIGISARTVALLPVYVAQDRGFFVKEGLKTSVVHFRGGAETMQAIISGDVHVYAGGPDTTISAFDAGVKMRIIAGVLNTMVYDIYSHPSLKTINDARGKRFAISKYGGLSDFVTRYFFKFYNFDPEKDIKILQVGSTPARLAALKSGAVDGAIIDPPLTDIAKRDGFNRLINGSEIMKDWCQNVMAVRADFIDKNRDNIKKLISGYKKAVMFVKTDREGTIKVIMDVMGVNRKDAESSYEYYESLFPADANINVKGLQIAVDIGKQTGEIKGNFTAKDVVDETFIKP